MCEKPCRTCECEGAAVYNKVWGAMPGEKKGSGEKRWKKVLTKREGFGILTKLSARWWAAAESERKKLLTVKLKCGNLNRLLRIQDGPGVKNFWKKFLTSGMKSSIIAMFRRERRAPCKLNNVTKRKHQRREFFMNSNQTLWVSSVSQLRESSNEKIEFEVMIKWLYEGLKSTSSLDTIL